MLQTKAVDLMELNIRLFDKSNEAALDSGVSTLVQPMAELAAAPVPLTEMLSADGSILTRMLEEYARRNVPELAERFSELSALIAEGGESFCTSDGRAKRLLDFVYPVV